MPNYNYKPIEHQHENMESLEQKWWRPTIDPKLLKELTKRRDGPGWINTIAYFVVLFITGYLSYLSWGTWWAWDARITSMLLLAIFYLMFILSWRIFDNNDKSIKVRIKSMSSVSLVLK